MSTLLSLNFTGSAATILSSLSPQPIGTSLVQITGTLRSSGSRAYRASDPTGEYQSNQHFGTADYTVSAVFRQLTVETANAFRLTGRRVDSSNYYFIEYSLATTDVKLWKRVSGSNTQIGSSYSWSPSTVTDYTWGLVMNGNEISATLGGSTVIGPVTDTGVDPADTTYQSVAIYLTSSGAWSASNGWHVDNLLVTDFASTGTIIQGAAMQRAMKDAETTASRKRLFFDIRDSAGAAWAGSVTGLKAKLSISGATEADSTNDIVRVNGALHYVELDNTEAASASPGDVICGRVAATTGRLESVSYLEITADDITTPALTVTEIANAVVEAEADALETYNRTTNTAATITTPTSGARTLTIATDATYEPIESIS